MPAREEEFALPVHWSVIEKPHPYGRHERKLRIEVTFQDGTVRVLARALKEERELHEYIDRKWPQAGWEKNICPKG